MDDYKWTRELKKCPKCKELRRVVTFQQSNSVCCFCRFEEIKKLKAKKIRERRLKDKLFKFKGDLRARISQDIKSKGYTKKSKTELILGADWLTVKKHFERQFTKGMTWDNQGKWHIDHIVPLASAKTEEEVIKLNHYTNLQPLWAEDNLKKSNTIINGTQTTLGI